MWAALPPPKGKAPEDWEDREQTLFRSTGFGDDEDRPLLKSNGAYAYFAPDIAYHRNKYQRGFKHMIIVLGADHGGYVKRLSAAVKALSGGEADIDVKLCQIVRLFKGGQPYKMSKRAGSFITARDLVEEVGAGPVRFMMLYRKNDAQLDFDLEKVVEQSNENPVFYVQYAHARACSVLSKAREGFPDIDLAPSSLARAKLDLLSDEAELALIKKIAQFPRTIEGQPKHMSRTGLLSSHMTLPLYSTAFGREAKVATIAVHGRRTLGHNRGATRAHFSDGSDFAVLSAIAWRRTNF